MKSSESRFVALVDIVLHLDEVTHSYLIIFADSLQKEGLPREILYIRVLVLLHLLVTNLPLSKSKELGIALSHLVGSLAI
jgi:hypothetical protein